MSKDVIDLNLMMAKRGLVFAQHDIENDEDYFRLGSRTWKFRAGYIPVDWIRMQNRDILCAKLEDVEDASHKVSV